MFQVPEVSKVSTLSEPKPTVSTSSNAVCLPWGDDERWEIIDDEAYDVTLTPLTGHHLNGDMARPGFRSTNLTFSKSPLLMGSCRVEHHPAGPFRYLRPE
jgi:hypothetical protein